jgi:chromosome segregation ATPase
MFSKEQKLNKQISTLTSSREDYSEYCFKLKARVKALRSEVKVLTAQLQQARKLATSKIGSPDDVSAVIREIGSSADVLLRSGLIPRESMLLDPVNAVKKTTLAVIQYFHTWADMAAGDLTKIGKGESNPYIVAVSLTHT